MLWITYALAGAVIVLALVIWHLDKRIAKLEGCEDNIFQRAFAAWLLSLSPQAQQIVMGIVMFAMFLGMACAFGLACAMVPAFLWLKKLATLKAIYITFGAGSLLYIAVSFALAPAYKRDMARLAKLEADKANAAPAST